jgi:hypothetical protein
MKTQPRRRTSLALVVYSLPLAICLLCAPTGFAQTDDSGQPPASGQSAATNQDQPGTADKDEQKPSEPSTTKLKISVYVRFNTSGGFLRHEKEVEMNFKTNQDGSVKVPEIPQGKVLIQVIATGWHTYGKWYDLEKDEETITIKLVPPPHWY